MRIIGGWAGGRRLAVPARGVRPTVDRVREALFNVLEARGEIAGAAVLDLFAGAGSLGLEAYSRGAASVVLVERDPKVCAVLADNVGVVAGRSTEVAVRRSAVSSYLRAPDGGRGDPTFDLVFCDPPYADPVDATLAALPARLAPGATVVLERDKRSPEPAWPAELEVEQRRTYGETTVTLARRAAENPSREREH